VDGFRKTSHELRIASPQDWPLTFVAGLYWQRQTHQIQQDYLVDGLASDLSVPGWPNTVWLTEQLRTDKDEAFFGEASYQITDQLKATAGIRAFHVDNSLKGFYGFNPNFQSTPGVGTCFAGPFRYAPCTDLDREVKESDHVGKFNLSYQIDPAKLIYATWSEGFRPGGVNRVAKNAPYLSDFLTNYEFGWKTSWMDGQFRWNGAVFDQKWKDFQFAFLPPNNFGLTEIRNASQARIRGLESNLNWAATDNLLITASGAWYDAKLTADYCGTADSNGNPVTMCAAPQAPKGTRLPITPKFKANLLARYNFDFRGLDAYVQLAGVHVGRRTSDLRVLQSSQLGDLPAYNTLDFSTGLHRNNWSLDAFIENVFDTHGQLARFAECAVCITHGAVPGYPNGQPYVIPVQPRTLGLRFTQDFD
jgi:outer membrane receptor protein involved in Fe transport